MRQANPATSVDLPSSETAVSIVVPVRNEADNILPLIEEITAALSGRRDYEIIYVNDGSTDATAERLAEAMKRWPNIRQLRHAVSTGQSAAVRSGVRAARGAIVATLDGDVQNNPAFLPELIAAVEKGAGVGLAAGQRVGRKDTGFKKFQSRVANAVRSNILRDGTRDTGCGLKAFRREVFLMMPYFDGLHRFLPALVRADANAAIATLVGAGGRNVEHEVFMKFDTKAPTLQAFRRSEALIRSFVSADIHQLAQLHQIGFGFDISYTAKHFDLSESDDRLLLVAELGGAIVGYCEIDASAKEWWIDGLVTSERVRRQGIATSLMISALEKVPTNASMYLNVSSRNPAALELYNKFGFSEFQRQSRFVFLGCEPVGVVNAEAAKP